VTAATVIQHDGSAWHRFLRGPAAPFAVVALAFVYQLPIFDRWFSFMDEGHMLLYADLIARGGELYRDATVYPLPGAFYLLAWIFRLVEPSNLVARWIVVVEFAVFVGLVFLLMRRMVPPGWALAGVFVTLLYRIWAFPHWHMYSYSTTALLVQLVALLTVVRFTETGDRKTLALAGLLFGIGVWCKQDYGAAAIVAMGATLCVYARTAPPGVHRSLWALGAWFLAPAAFIGAATAVHFLRQGLFGDFLQFTVLNHFVGMASYDYPTFPSLLPLFEQDPQLRSVVGSYASIPAILYNADFAALQSSFLYRETAVYDTALKAFYYGPYLLLPIGALRLWWRRGALYALRERPGYLAEFALYAFAAGLIALVTLNRPQDYVHLVVLYWPLLCLGVLYAHALLRPRRVLAWALAAVLAVPAGALVAYTGRLAYRLRVLNSTPIESERAGIYVKPGHAKLLNELVAYVKTHSGPDEPVAVLPYFPILHFLAERRGPHRSSYIVWPFPELPDRDRRVIGAMDETDTQLLIYLFNEFVVFDRMESFASELFAHLVDHFETVRVFNYDYADYKLGAARRVDGPPEGRPLLVPRGDGIALSIRSTSTPPQPIPPEERDRYLAEALWPFRRVIALRPTLDRRTVVSVPVQLPEGARLRTAVGVHPGGWDQHPPVSVRFEIAISEGERRDLVYARTLRPTPDFEDRGWFEVDLRLDAWAGRPVTLEFSTQTDAAAGERLVMGGWETPRIVVAGVEDRAP
jgi:hypothetical protein